MISVLEKSPTLHWLGRQLFNRDDPAAFFDPLLERINPMWVRQYTPARVKAIYNETADTKTFVLAPAGRWKGFAAGQHVNIGIDVDGVRGHISYIIGAPQPEEEGSFEDDDVVAF